MKRIYRITFDRQPFSILTNTYFSDDSFLERQKNQYIRTRKWLYKGLLHHKTLPSVVESDGSVYFFENGIYLGKNRIDSIYVTF